MPRQYQRITLTTLTIDCLFLVVGAPFKIMRSGYKYHQRNRAGSIEVMSGVKFERYVARLLERNGYRHVRLTERYDYGVDIIAEKDGVKWGIQVKRHSGLVKANAVRQVVTALRKYDCNRAMVITNSSFSHVATELAQCNDCVLIDGKRLARWL